MAHLPAIDYPGPGEYVSFTNKGLCYIRSPYWKAPILSFIDENCTIFDADDENKLDYTEIHNGFKQLVEELLNGVMMELGVNENIIMLAFKSATDNPTHQKILEQLLAVDSFVAFKKLMVKKNLELNEEALKMMSMEEKGLSEGELLNQELSKNAAYLEAQFLREQAEMEEAIAMSLAADDQKIQAMKDEEDQQMIEAMELSRKDSEQQNIENIKQSNIEKIEQEKIEQDKIKQDKIEQKPEKVEATKIEQVPLPPIQTKKSEFNAEEFKQLVSENEEKKKKVEEYEKAAQKNRDVIKKQEQLIREESKVSEQELKQRQDRLKAHRDKLIAKKRGEMRKELDDFQKGDGRSQKEMIQKGMKFLNLGAKELEETKKKDDEMAKRHKIMAGMKNVMSQGENEEKKNKINSFNKKYENVAKAMDERQVKEQQLMENRVRGEETREKNLKNLHGDIKSVEINDEI